MVCPPVRGDNPRALVSGLSAVQVGSHGKPVLHQYKTLHSSRLSVLKSSKGGIRKKERMGRNPF